MRELRSLEWSWSSSNMCDRPGRELKIGPVVRVASGNFLEMYDFQIFAYYAPAIAATIFPNGSEYTSLMASLATFGAGFLMRPLGAVVIGSYVDCRGRRAGLLLTLALMSIGTLSIACTPSYAAIGVLAPLLVVAGRLVQGLSAGVENGGVSVYLSEIATREHKGFYVSWQSGSQQLAVIATGVIGLLLNARLSAKQITDWGWRIPLLAGCMIIPILLVLRRSLEETQVFIRRKDHLGPQDILRTLAANWRLVLVAVMLVIPNGVYYYMITAYTPTFGSAILHLPASITTTVILCVGVSNLVWLPVMGALSDQIGRRPLLIGATLATLLTAYPAVSWLVNAPSFGRLLGVELWFSCLFGTYVGASIVLLTEIMPVEIRTTGFSFALSGAGAFTGFGPAICTYLIHVTGNPAVPGLWVSFGAVLGMTASLLLYQDRATGTALAGISSPVAQRT